MRIVKLRVSDYKNLEKFYERNNLITKSEYFSQTRPGDVYISKVDADKFKKGLKKTAKKQNLQARSLEIAVAMYWLNLGPNESLSEGIRPGYALIVEEELDTRFKKDLNEILSEDF